ncbi:tetratricopeptide repeat protein [Plectonema cf. radiosum LEGE 06105]|uniref:Tetratricopeptide repeat protein n=1 Tax=Plectonema cf. radiosum LEGE 06105 TaxID=945769 RepID=A0A8J7JU79_9CYAN|nr:tetratricopeptide repeat protein [Plectonema radiosum]MBE9213130.1 tetratricopeptide repeat protein [Plectonema cf. radiosum LEGE 06105]
MSRLKLVLTCLSLAALSNFIVNVPSVKASSVAVQEVQTKAKYWFDQGIMKFNEGNYQEALEAFTKAINIDSGYAEAYYRRGLIHAKYPQNQPLNIDGTVKGCERVDTYRIICPVSVQNKVQETKRNSITDFTKAIQLNPQYTAAYHQRGLLQENGESKLQDLEMAVNLYYSKIPVYLKENKYETAAKILQAVEEINIAKKSVNPQIFEVKTSSDRNPIGSSTDSPNKKSPEDLIDEAFQVLNKGDVQTALQKLEEAGRIYQERKNEGRYQEMQRMIAEIKGKVK